MNGWILSHPTPMCDACWIIWFLFLAGEFWMCCIYYTAKYGSVSITPQELLINIGLSLFLQEFNMGKTLITRWLFSHIFRKYFNAGNQKLVEEDRHLCNVHLLYTRLDKAVCSRLGLSSNLSTMFCNHIAFCVCVVFKHIMKYIRYILIQYTCTWI